MNRSFTNKKRHKAKRKHIERGSGKHHPGVKKRGVSIVGLSIAIVVVLLLVSGGIYTYIKFNKMNHENELSDAERIQIAEEILANDPKEEVDESLDVMTDEEASNVEVSLVTPIPDDLLPEGIYNILLLGVDNLNPEEFDKSRSDVMMMVTLDTINDEIHLTSFMRDIYINIEGHGNNRLNTAILYNGPTGTEETIEKYFGIHTDYYAIVNFAYAAEIIDVLGGVDITLKPGEAIHIDDVEKSGTYHFNGHQAVQYMRLRAVGEGDFERTQRQRLVLSTIAEGLNDITLAEVMSLMNKMPNYVRTDMPAGQMTKFGSLLFSLRSAPIDELRIPVDGEYRMVRRDIHGSNASVLYMNEERMKTNAEIAMDFIYGDNLNSDDIKLD